MTTGFNSQSLIKVNPKFIIGVEALTPLEVFPIPIFFISYLFFKYSGVSANKCKLFILLK
jgi:hypothetical protein